MLATNSDFKMFSASSKTKGLRCAHLSVSAITVTSLSISYNSDKALKDSTDKRTHYPGHDYGAEVGHWAPSPEECFSA